MTDPWLTVLHGDCRAMLAGLPAESVHACVTSPPYWSLRDYGTAVWVGGDNPECDHMRPGQPRSERPNVTGSGIGQGGAYFDAQDKGSRIYRDTCGLCGAIRVEPTVWGGEPLHEHDWSTAVLPGNYNYQDAIADGTWNDGQQIAAASTRSHFCSCGAWRGALGLEPTPELYVDHIVEVFRAVRRVLRRDGTLWLNLGDCYASSSTYNTGQSMHTEAGWKQDGDHRPNAGIPPGLKAKDLVGIPWMVAFALRADGWYLRMDVVWSKPNPMPESVEDRPTKSHEYLFLLAKSARYFYDAAAVREIATHAREARWDSGENGLESSVSRAGSGKSTRRFGSAPAAPVEGKQAQTAASAEAAGGSSGRRMGGFNARWDAAEGAQPLGRNKRSVWEVATQPYPGSHFATYPAKLVEPCILAGTSARGVCAECGAPFRRVEAQTEEERPDFKGSTFDSGKTFDRDGGDRTQPGPRFVTVTVGWERTCEHEGHEPVPATVLDPFAGSGTTGLVAQQLSRRAVLVDLNGEYLEMLMERNRQQPLGLAVG